MRDTFLRSFRNIKVGHKESAFTGHPQWEKTSTKKG